MGNIETISNNETQALYNSSNVENGTISKGANLTFRGISVQMMAAIQTASSMCIFTEKAELQAPSSDVMDLMDEMITLNEEMQKKLGINSRSVPRGEFARRCVEMFANDNNNRQKLEEDSEMDLDKMSGEDIEMLCLLLCSKSKSQMIETLRGVLDAKIKDRAALNKEYISKQNEIANEQVKAAKELAKAKKRAIIKAIFGAIFAVVAAVVAVVAAVATAGAGAVLFACAIAGAVCACAGAACSVASTGLTIAALTTESKDLAEKLNNANKIIGYVGTVFAIAGFFCSIPGMVRSIPRLLHKLPDIFKKALQAAKDLSKVAKGVQIAGDIAQGASMGVSGGFAIAEGVANKKLAKLNAQMDTIKIEMAKLDEEIKFLSQFIESIDEVIQLLIKNIMDSEGMAAKEYNISNDNKLNLERQI